MNGYVISVMSADHPGIVSAVSTSVEQLGANIIACSQTVLNGYFTLIMIIELPELLETEELRGKVNTFLGGDYQVTVRASQNAAGKVAAGEVTDTFVISVFGNDRPGIIREFTHYLSDRDINIVDLYGEKVNNEFHLIGQLEIPTDMDVRMIQDDLEEIGKQLGFTVRLQHKNIFTATNDLRFN
ncbi:MAG: hypothetical protein LBU65_15260 [Planctomycetaceae bacterium]|jgi:glycine cleavage system transcriptional repressor|nr:hypothetical protein [Planctomycetaceae bacterium]